MSTMPDDRYAEARLSVHSAHLMKLPKHQLADRLAEVMAALDEASDTFQNINIAAYYGGQAMDAKKRGGREKLDYIERQALGGWADAIGMLEVGRAGR